MNAVTLDATGLFPTLLVPRPAGGGVALNSRRNPVVDAGRHLDTILRGTEPPVIVLIGLGLGYVLDAIEQRGWTTNVIAFEPLPESIAHFLTRRDWTSWLDSGRLHIVAGPEYDGADAAWLAAAPASIPPIIVDSGLAQARPDSVPGARGAIARARYGTPLDPRLLSVSQSMLHQKVLTMLEHFAATARGAIVEVGAYLGGATIVMTRGIRDSGRATPMFTIEPGGAHPTHPHLPADDIFGGLQANLRQHELEPYVTLLQGVSSDPAIVATVRTRLAKRGLPIGLLCIDADGQVQRDFDTFLPMCANGCVLVVDDYSGPPENIKADMTKVPVDALVTSGRARELGVFGWGTWVGIYTPSASRA